MVFILWYVYFLPKVVCVVRMLYCLIVKQTLAVMVTMTQRKNRITESALVRRLS